MGGGYLEFCQRANFVFSVQLMFSDDNNVGSTDSSRSESLL